MAIGLLDLLRIKHFCSLETACDLVANPASRKSNPDISSHLKIINDCHVWTGSE